MDVDFLSHAELEVWRSSLSGALCEWLSAIDSTLVEVLFKEDKHYNLHWIASSQ